MNSDTARYLNLPGYRTGRNEGAPLAPAEVVADDVPWADRAINKGRMAVDGILDVVNPFKMQDGKISGLRYGRVGGLAALSSLLAAVNELNDPTESAGRNLAQAVGAGGGGLVGPVAFGAAGGLAGRAVGGTLGSAAGPVGTLIGATLGGVIGPLIGKAVTTAGADVFEGSPAERAIRDMERQQRAAIGLKAEEIERLMPLQEQAAQIALRNEEKRNRINAEIAGQQMLQAALAQSLLAQQAGYQGTLSDINGALLRG